MNVMEGLLSRRSIRTYEDRPVSREHLNAMLTAGIWAPSGLNNQPWRFVIVQDAEWRKRLATLTTYHFIIEAAPVCIAVFLDREAMYHEVKDHLAIGACIQNMLLAAHAMGLGAVWLGEILKNAGAVRKLFCLSEQLELMAVVAVGHPVGKPGTSQRKDLREFLLKDL